MNICSVCSKKTINSPVDIKSPIYCDKCNPKYKCVVCGKPRMRPIGHSEFCEKCFKKNREKTIAARAGITIIDKTKVPGLSVSESHYKRMNSRVIDDNGNTLSGDAGVSYMKSKGNMYANRLKEYYK